MLNKDIMVTRPSGTNLGVGILGSNTALNSGGLGLGGPGLGLNIGLDSFDKKKLERDEKEQYIK